MAVIEITKHLGMIGPSGETIVYRKALPNGESRIVVVQSPQEDHAQAGGLFFLTLEEARILQNFIAEMCTNATENSLLVSPRPGVPKDTVDPGIPEGS